MTKNPIMTEIDIYEAMFIKRKKELIDEGKTEETAEQIAFREIKNDIWNKY